MAPGSRSAQTVQSFLAALEALDAEPIASLLAEDVTEVLPLAASGGTDPAAVFDGRDEVMRVQRVIVTEFSTVEFVDPVVTASADGGTVFVECLGRRVHRKTGRTYENRYLLKFELNGGLIARITEYSNPVTFAKFFGEVAD